ncbi:MAG: EboA family metabolite traffic protein [Cyanobacteria bacterium P01_G01_bin.49]
MNQTLAKSRDLLQSWLSQQLEQDSWHWLNQKRQEIAKGASPRVFFLTFSSVSRYVGKQDLTLVPKDWQNIAKVRPGWFPGHWSVAQAARSLLVLSLPHDNSQDYIQTVEQVFTTADIEELVALYQTLPLLPYPQAFCLRAAEGVRSNMVAVFNSVALRNPYPAEYFDDLAWNQMVLKALFVDSPLALIHGLDNRVNPQLIQMLVDYAHERLAAQRSVSPELWRLVKQSGNATVVANLERVLAHAES